ncbi:phosphate ABC transporter membrane protein 2, PhoT family [Austwickia chelonae]|uniref:Phosphate transport system permease protein PstA n=1 Tax=Austwickia chelonae NBRC 105200 TaxID=1184607 RepID=K6VM33_9MICO|nr:phosphate ABC transporter permease PstA [Austwickia chelonae]GAB77804.1 phosphate ABC transporter permease protein [Austwickia chelonae NBRC 105200]SEV89833.1 phosphate ABC transporter membrane protein 2, PhoT family [Austwickia chelonae]
MTTSTAATGAPDRIEQPVDLSLSGGHSHSRTVRDVVARVVMCLCFALAVLPLLWIVYTVLSNGLGLLLEVGWWNRSQAGLVSTIRGGGAYHAIVGTLLQALVTASISVPVGVLVAIYLVEYGRGRLSTAVSFMVDVLTGVPSIVAALFVYALWVGVFDLQRVGFAVTLALVLLMIPTVIRSTEEMLKLVPNELREASYALGVPKWKTIVSVVLPTAFNGIVTGVLLGLARVMGETAPLLVLGPYTKFINLDLLASNMATLPTMINQERMEALAPAVERAWAAALTLILLVLMLNLVGRFIARTGTVKA